VKRDTKNSVEKERLKAGLTQVELAERVEVTRQTIISIEKGDYTPSVALALRLSKVFRISVEELFALC
jgi:putative transcriptional regulator